MAQWRTQFYLGGLEFVGLTQRYFRPPGNWGARGQSQQFHNWPPPYCIHHCRERLECATSVMARTGHIYPPGKQGGGGVSYNNFTTEQHAPPSHPTFTTGADGVSDSCDGSFWSYLPLKEWVGGGNSNTKNSNYYPSLRHQILNLQDGFPNTVKFVRVVLTMS